MKNLTFYSFILLLVFSCSQSETPPRFYGQSFDTTQVISVADLLAKMQGQNRVDAVIAGTITESCQSEGCWLNLKNNAGDDLFVDWDHQFNTPFKLTGKRAIARGYAYIDSSNAVKVIAFKATGVFL